MSIVSPMLFLGAIAIFVAARIRAALKASATERERDDDPIFMKVLEKY